MPSATLRRWDSQSRPVRSPMGATASSRSHGLTTWQYRIMRSPRKGSSTRAVRVSRASPPLGTAAGPEAVHSRGLTFVVPHQSRPIRLTTCAAHPLAPGAIPPEARNQFSRLEGQISCIFPGSTFGLLEVD